MLSTAKLIEKNTIKMLFIALTVVYISVCSVAILAVYQAQDSQRLALESLALTDQQLIHYANEPLLTSPFSAQLVLAQDNNSRQLAIKNTRWYLSFHPPSFVVFTSPLLLLFTVVLIILGLVLGKTFKQQLRISLKPLQRIESWAHLAVIQGGASELNVYGSTQERDTISLAIHQLQRRMHENMTSDVAWDQNIRASALLDQETRIGNRAFFDNRLQAFVKEEDAQGAVLLIQFKELELVHKLYGYQQAMVLLSTLIQVTKQRLQGQPSYFLARHSEYELSVLLPGVFIQEVEKLTERLLKNLQTVVKPVGINQEEFVHIGISYFGAEQVPYQIMSEADMALRTAQLQGPSQWFMFEAGELEAVKAKGSLKWRTFFNSAINSNGFVIFFQPVIASDTAKILHHEVLSKVRDKNGTLVSARVFLPMAKKCGLTVPIDLLILEQVCRVLAYENKQQDGCSINISIDSLLSVGFTEKFLAVLQRFPEVRGRLMVEISEYQLVNHLAELQAPISELSHAGVKIVADKVGQYVVSAHYINEHPIYAMKLHRSIIMDIDKKTENQVFIQSLKTLVTAKQIPIYALGVEKQTEWRTLLHLGVKGGQGHFFTEPMAQVAKAIHLD